MGDSTTKLATIVFTDIVGFTKLSSENEPLAIQLLDTQRATLRPIVDRHNGEWLKEMGDGLLLLFNTTKDAVDCAIEIQHTVKNVANLDLRIGIHQGEVVSREGDVFGDDVNVASRIEPFASPGGIVISGRVNSSLTRNPTYQTKLIGKPELKGISQEIKLYSIISHGLPDAKPIRELLQDQLADQEKSEKKKKSKMPLIMGTAIGVMIAGAIFFVISSGDKAAPTSDELSIAVLPFVNMSSDKENEYFSDGMTEEILNSLVKIKELKVAGRTSSFAFKNKNIDLREIGKQLSVAYVVEGSVQKYGNDIKVTAQLIRVSDGYHLLSNTYKRKFEDIFKIQEEISNAIAEQMKIKLIVDEIVEHRGSTQNPKALDLYMQARYEMNKMSEKSLHKAIQLFKDAIAIDPEYALAYSGIADCYIAMENVNHFKYYKSDDIENYSNAKTYSKKALDIEPDLGEALAVVARMKHVLDKDYPEAERLFNNAIELSPDHPTSYDWYGSLLAWRLKDNPKARTMYKKALKLDPLSPSIHASIGVFYLQVLEDIDSAYYYLNKAFQLSPDYVNGNDRFIFTELLESRHEWARAEKEWNITYNLNPKNYATLWGLSFHYLLRGNLQKSNIYLSKLKEMNFELADDYALEGWYNFYGKNNIEASIPYFKKTITRSSNPKQFQYWIVWYDLLYAMGKSQKCDEIDNLNFKNIWLEFENKERNRIAEKIYFAYVEFFCNSNSNILEEFNDDEFMLESRPNNYEYYFYTKIILLLESGEIEEALSIIENGYEFAKTHYYSFLRHPALLPLKDNQRFQKILSRASME